MSEQPAPSTPQGFQAEDDEHTLQTREHAGAPPADCFQAEGSEHNALTPDPADAAARPSS